MIDRTTTGGHDVPIIRYADPLAQKEIDRLRAGADPTPVRELEYPTPAQLWQQLLDADLDQRMSRLNMLTAWAHRGTACVQADHSRLEEVNADLRGRLAAVTETLDRWEARLRESITQVEAVKEKYDDLSPEAKAKVETVTNKENSS